jgi:hypothetical protein
MDRSGESNGYPADHLLTSNCITMNKQEQTALIRYRELHERFYKSLKAGTGYFGLLPIYEELQKAWAEYVKLKMSS